MSWIPPEPPLPDDHRASATSSLRYEDVAQDGRLQLLTLPHGIGLVVWDRLLTRHPAAKGALKQGILPLITRLAIAGTDATISVRSPLDLDGSFELAHTRAAGGAVDRLILRMWVRGRGRRGRTHGPPPPDAGATVDLGSVYVEHVFTRPFAPPGQRKVRSLAGLEGFPAIPPAEVAWHEPEELLAPSPGDVALDELEDDGGLLAFGLAHTDSNQHVNSLAYPRLVEDAVVRRLAGHGIGTAVLMRAVELAYRKPCFAGERYRLRLRTFRGERDLGAVAAFEPTGGGRAHVTVRMRLA